VSGHLPAAVMPALGFRVSASRILVGGEAPGKVSWGDPITILT